MILMLLSGKTIYSAAVSFGIGAMHRAVHYNLKSRKALRSILAGSILNAMKAHKITAFLILIFFAVPIATAFCCCTDFDPNQSRQEMMGHNHESHDHGSHHHGSGQDDKSSPGSCECGNEILANVVNRTTIDFSAINTHFSKLQNDPIFQLHIVSALQATQNSFYDTGPPGQSFATPLYLQISNLRI